MSEKLLTTTRQPVQGELFDANEFEQRELAKRQALGNVGIGGATGVTPILDFPDELRTIPSKSTQIAKEEDASWMIKEASEPKPDVATIASDTEEAWKLHDGEIAIKELEIETQARKEAEAHAEQALEESMHDSLTGLPNRAALEEYVKKVGLDGIQGLAIIDLVDFKSVNDEFGGHDEGDKVLLEFTAILTEELKDIGMGARTGGDEFAAAVYKGAKPEDVKRAFARIKQRTSEITRNRTTPLTAEDPRSVWNGGASIGYAHRDLGYETFDAGMKVADNMMYEDKAIDRKDGNVMKRSERRTNS